MADPILVAKGKQDLSLLPQLANRHGLVAGATGTGKTVTLRVLAEGFSRLGVPVFLADVKGDLSGLARPGGDAAKVQERAKALGLALDPQACPVVFLDVFGEAGHPLRATISEMGPLLLGRVLGLNETQEGVLQIAFRVADESGLLLLDLKDLRAMLEHVSTNAAQLRARYGNVSSTSVGAIQRALLALEAQGGDRLFGEPALALEDLLRQDLSGRGQVTVLQADKLVRSPALYATLLLWLLSELYEQLPEVGDPEKPRLVFFFDEAHLLFTDAPDELRQKVEQVVRLIRSKGVGVYFVTQNPLDVPDAVLGQLGNRVQHALRAFTPRDQKAVRAAAETFRANPGLDVGTAITELAVGEALVSFLDAAGTPRPVERAFVVPPRSRLAPLTPEERAQVMAASPLRGRYDTPVDRESAYERLTARAVAREEGSPPPLPRGRPAPTVGDQAGQMLGKMAQSAMRAAGTQLGREIMRGILGGIFGGGGRRR
ncbi:helicase HerA-like domain-containing protein [Anaeromyxobacter oryzae]|uniref:ATP-binding protein n=1 Tax=Anaeromyxobacter oryzae TaxID=2918170 RepID=A0ABM7WVS8_9BACT|nr:helicase HerA-like domain-containing protein [Anaeromyxobacter oryzae]BDG03612.1 ATP-binding protein [Anaeromyxobacter oryzae]